MAEDRRYVLQIVGDLAGGGGGAPRGPGMGGSPVQNAGPQAIQNPNLNLMAKHLREIAAGTTGLGGTLKNSLKATGIQFSLAGILKQSQLFTGMIGSIFQILGAGVDIILAAFMPILIPAIRLLANVLPILKTIVDNTLGRLVEWVVKGVEFIMGDTLKNTVDNAVTSLMEKGLGENSPIAEKTGDVAGNVAKFAGVGVIAALLTLGPIGRFLKIGGGIAKVMSPIGTAIKGIGKLGPVNAVLTFLKGSKFVKAITAGFSGAKGLIGGVGKAISGVVGKGLSKIPGFGKGGGIAKIGAKFGAKGLIPGLGAAMIAAETALDAVKNVKEARAQGAGWGKALSLGGATVAAGGAAAALSLVAPMAGLALQEGGKMGMNVLMNQAVGTNRGIMDGTLTGGVINIVNNVNGVTENSLHEEMNKAKTENTFNSDVNRQAVYPSE